MTIAPIPITGLALCNALGGTRAEVRQALYEGRTGLGSPSLQLPFETAVGQVRTALAELPADLSAWSTRTNRIAALLIAELEVELVRMRQRWKPERIAIILGTSTAGADVTESAYRKYLQEGSFPKSFDLFKHHTYGSVLHVVRTLSQAHGPAWVISTACTSSAKPLASAQRLIASGVIDAAIVGGIDTLCAMTLKGFHALEALSAKPCRPFAADRDGLNIGEGGALLLMERQGDPLAVLEGVGETSDAYHISAPQPEGLGAKMAMQQALLQAQRQPHEVSLINAHGTGTRLNDTAEAKAICALFGREVPVLSTKGYTGHMLGAAGATEAAFAVMAIAESWTPLSYNATPIDPRIEINVVTQRTQRSFARVLSNGFAFGGNNVSLLFGAP